MTGRYAEMRNQAATPRVQVDCGGKSRTKQAHKDECDLNVIVRKHSLQLLPEGWYGDAKFGDFSDVTTYHEALTMARDAEASFAMLPAHVRRWADNDPELFLKLVADPSSRVELEELGMPDLADQLFGQEKAVPEEPAPAPVAGGAGPSVPSVEQTEAAAQTVIPGTEKPS